MKKFKKWFSGLVWYYPPSWFMLEPKYSYFFSYSYYGDPNSTIQTVGNGNIEIITNYKIKEYSSFEGILKVIREKNGGYNTVITYFCLLNKTYKRVSD